MASLQEDVDVTVPGTENNGKLAWLLKLSRARWTRRIGATFIDQALFAGTNFLLNILLAIWMTPEEYGAFVLAYAWFLLVLSIYDAVLSEPMGIFGAGKYAATFQRYLGLTYFGHIGLGFIAFLVLVVGALVTYLGGSQILGEAMFGISIAAPMILMRWLTRQPFYVLSKPHLSALGNFVYLISALVLVFGFHIFNILSPFSAPLVMGLGGLISSLFLTFVFLHPEFKKADPAVTAESVIKDHWDYGRWSTGSRFLSWIPDQVYYLVFPLFVDLSASGALSVLLYLIMPVMMTITAMVGLLIPSFVRIYNGQGIAGVTARVKLVIGLMVILTGLYGLAIVILGIPALHWVFNGKYDASVNIPVLLTLGLIPTLGAINTILDAALRAMGGVKQTFISKILPAVITLTIGIVLLANLGILGRNLATLLGQISAIGLLWRFYRMRMGEVKSPVEGSGDSLEASIPATID